MRDPRRSGGVKGDILLHHCNPLLGRQFLCWYKDSMDKFLILGPPGASYVFYRSYNKGSSRDAPKMGIETY